MLPCGRLSKAEGAQRSLQSRVQRADLFRVAEKAGERNEQVAAECFDCVTAGTAVIDVLPVVVDTQCRYPRADAGDQSVALLLVNQGGGQQVAKEPGQLAGVIRGRAQPLQVARLGLDVLGPFNDLGRR